MSADYEGALLQLTITGGTSPVRRRPSTVMMMVMMVTMIVAMKMVMIKLSVDVYGYLYLAGLFPSLYHYVVHGFLKRNFMVDSFLDYQGNVSSSSVDLYLGLLHRLPDWSVLWW